MNCVLLITPPYVKHISGRFDKKADYLSRDSRLHDYSLDQFAFRSLLRKIKFSLECDNNKWYKYVSISHDPGAFQRDAFSVVLGNRSLYISSDSFTC